MNSPLGLFEGYGIEIELMIVKSDDLSVLPVADELMRKVAGTYVSDIEDGEITWSNELVSHVIELKTTAPARTLEGLGHLFHQSVIRINSILKEFNAQLLPSAMHPFMNPVCDSKLWQHDNNEVYDAYNRIFDCRGHGWSNLQSMHINLPFKDDNEFRKLHSSIRCLLPLLPGICASSPIVEGKVTGAADNRLLFYQQNQKRIPSIAGQVIPEAVRSIGEYHDRILSRIYSDIAPFDQDEILRDDWLNSRGAIARFGRQTIEIRVMDCQECPNADLALADLVVRTLKAMIAGDIGSIESFEAMPVEALKNIFDRTAQLGSAAIIDEPEYLQLMGLKEKKAYSVVEIWRTLFQRTSSLQGYGEIQDILIKNGTLSSRIQKQLSSSPTTEEIKEVYRKLGICLAKNQLFL